MKIVITGTTCAGKTTTLNILKDKKFTIIPESALEIIEEEQKKGDKAILPNTDVEKFQILVFNRQMELEKDLDEKEIYLLDRSLVDIYGYANFYNVKYPEEIKTLSPNRYDKVFHLEPLDFCDGKFGFEDRETQLAIDKMIRKAYKDFGYTPIIVPFMSVEERIDFILKEIS